MALERGGAKKIYERNENLLAGVQSARDYEDFVRQNRGQIFDDSVLRQFGDQGARGSDNLLGNRVSQTVTPSGVQRSVTGPASAAERFAGGQPRMDTGGLQRYQAADRYTEQAGDAFAGMSDAELAAITGQSTRLNPGNLSLGEGQFQAGPRAAPAFKADAGNVYASLAKGDTYDFSNITGEEQFNLLRNIDPNAWAQSQEASFRENLDDERKFGINDVIRSVAASGMMAGLGNATGISKAIGKGFGNLFSKLKTPAAVAKSGSSLASAGMTPVGSPDLGFGQLASLASGQPVKGASMYALGTGTPLTIPAGAQFAVNNAAGAGAGAAAGLKSAASYLGRGNAVPGLSSGITTPGNAGGLTTAQGAGRAAVTGPTTLAGSGGAPLGSSPLAVAGGATPVGGVRPLPSGRIDGTNINVGEMGGTPQSAKSGATDALRRNAGDIIQNLLGGNRTAQGATPMADDPSAAVLAGVQPMLPNAGVPRSAPRYFDVINTGDDGGHQAYRSQINRNWLAGKPTRGLPWQA